MPSFSSYSTFSTRVCTSHAPPPKQGSSGRRDSFASSRPASRTSFSNQRYRHFQKLWSVSISKNTLRIDGISTISYDWRSKTSTPGAQIDLVIERDDKIVNLCEIKYSQTPYFIDKDEYQKLLNWREAFQRKQVYVIRLGLHSLQARGLHRECTPTLHKAASQKMT